MPSSRRLKRISLRLRNLNEIRFPDGSVTTSQAPAIARQLRTSPAPAGFRAARRKLDNLDQSLRAPPVRAPTPAEDHRLGRILSAPEFHQKAANPIQTWLAPRYHRLSRWLSRQLSSHNTAFGFLGLLIVLAVALVAIFLGRRALRDVARDTRRASAEARAVTAGEAERQAQAYAASGEYRMALRSLFISTLLRLQESGLIVPHASLTNREFLLHLRRQTETNGQSNSLLSRAGLNALEEMIEEFDTVWYGHQGVDSERYDRNQRLAETVMTLTRLERAA